MGITQGIGTGGRDLNEDVGGLMMLAGLQALQEDPATQVIVLVSKPPAAAVAEKVRQQVLQSGKPTVVCLLGGKPWGDLGAAARHVYPVRTLEEAAIQAAALASPDGDSGSASDGASWIRRRCASASSRSSATCAACSPAGRCATRPR